MQKITVKTSIRAPIEKIWSFWTEPMHIKKWNNASPDWECPDAENDVQVGGKFRFTMSAKDGSAKFDFTGTYTEITPYEKIAYTIDDGRKVKVTFKQGEHGVHIIETFEMGNENTEEVQRAGWQAILDSFKNYVESQ